MERKASRTSSNLVRRSREARPFDLHRGFTIVELLIVVVVIAILAAITIVSYNGISDQAEDASRRADINILMKQAELFKVKNSHYPKILNVAADSPTPELETLLRDASLYEKTRQVSGKTDRTFIFCSSPDFSVFTVIAKPKEFDRALPAGGTLADRAGTPLIYSTNGAMGATPFTVDALLSGNVGANICKSVHPEFGPGWKLRWSFDVPTDKAQ
jgi:prepilin-type N-terminal cleavage/methylation domain-containing protein